MLGLEGKTPPSDVITRGVIGAGGRGSGFVLKNEPGGPYRTLAVCDVDEGRLKSAVAKAGEPCRGYRDFRDLLDRFYSTASSAVFAHEGMVDKFVGD